MHKVLFTEVINTHTKEIYTTKGCLTKSVRQPLLHVLKFIAAIQDQQLTAESVLHL